MKILVLNDSYFGETLQSEGNEILRVGLGAENDIVIDPSRDDLSEVIEAKNFKPDVVLQVDSIDQRVFFRGIEKIAAPMAFYAIDAPINSFWQKDYAHQFDRVWVDQHDIWREWVRDGVDWVRWLPLAADQSIYHKPSNGGIRDIPIVFVGTLDFDKRPKRSAILYRLKQITDVKIVHGDGVRNVGPKEVAGYYRRAKIVLNELLFDGINLRTFEAMSCGAAVLTEEKRGEERLFRDGHNIVTFNEDNLEEIVLSLLDDDSDVQRIGYNGANVINEKHTLQHRADQILRDLAKMSIRRERLNETNRTRANVGIWNAAMKWEYLREVAQEKLAQMVASIGKLDVVEQASLLESVGQGREAKKILVEELMNGDKRSVLKTTLASMHLNENNYEAASVVLDMNTQNPALLHVKVGNMLANVGRDIDPGFNRYNMPMSRWYALEHFGRAYNIDQDCFEAIEGMDRVLREHHSVEFILPVLQKFHLKHPKNEDVQMMMCARAQNSYFRTNSNGNGRATSVRKDSRRSEGQKRARISRV